MFKLGITGAARKAALAPSFDDVAFERNGFPGAPSAATSALQTVPQSVVCGFEWAIEGSSLSDLASRLDLLDPTLRGFGYEGAAMAYTIRDVVRRRGTRTRDLLDGPGAPHLFLAYIGVGFAMARLPRRMWRTVVPQLTVSPYHPTMSWLAVDGYGFDKAYFDAERWVNRQESWVPYPWQGHPGYFARTADQGVGRALWFIHGADTRAVIDAVESFAPSRRADLWSGVGLAATFAGGADEDGLLHLRSAAGLHRPDLALGACFASKARVWAGHVPAHSAIAAKALSHLDSTELAELADATHQDDPHGAEPGYALWRKRIRAELGSGSASVK